MAIEPSNAGLGIASASQDRSCASSISSSMDADMETSTAFENAISQSVMPSRRCSMAASTADAVSKVSPTSAGWRVKV